MPPVLTLTFPSTTRSAIYGQILPLARACPGYAEVPIAEHLPLGGRISGARRPVVLHQITFEATGPDLARLAELWARIGRWTTTRLLVDGVPILPRERRRIGVVLECMARASRLRADGTLEFDPPQRYCRSATVRPLRQIQAVLPPLPCRLWAESWGAYDVEWHRDRGRREDQIRAGLMDLGVTRCPFLRLGPFLDALDAIPLEVLAQPEPTELE